MDDFDPYLGPAGKLAVQGRHKGRPIFLAIEGAEEEAGRALAPAKRRQDFDLIGEDLDPRVVLAQHFGQRLSRRLEGMHGAQAEEARFGVAGAACGVIIEFHHQDIARIDQRPDKQPRASA